MFVPLLRLWFGVVCPLLAGLCLWQLRRRQAARRELIGVEVEVEPRPGRRRSR